ncbi:unnamed protein product [Plutella xylostella]|uniref:(diamondback moth) hypothetical protein n=1 Tax=Plutella xylostella TaxID=51655 RepID=A0A8S4G431_PLUXY|nr:unnamed protein product [Plutella xylostella]
MLFKNRPHIRELGLKRIIATRKNLKPGIRIYKVQKLNFEAHYTDMIVWSESQITSPPILQAASDSQLSDLGSGCMSVRYGECLDDEETIANRKLKEN